MTQVEKMRRRRLSQNREMLTLEESMITMSEGIVENCVGERSDVER